MRQNCNGGSPIDAKQQVLQLEAEWVTTEVKHDEATLRRILDDKFLASFGSIHPCGKEAFIKLILAGDIDPTGSQTMTDRNISLDHDTAAVVGTDTVRGTETALSRAVSLNNGEKVWKRHETP